MKFEDWWNISDDEVEEVFQYKVMKAVARAAWIDSRRCAIGEAADLVDNFPEACETPNGNSAISAEACAAAIRNLEDE